MLLVKKIIKVRGENAKYFVCKLKNEDDENAFKNQVIGVYPINMVFDKNIYNADSELPALSSYRSNFLSSEIII